VDSAGSGYFDQPVDDVAVGHGYLDNSRAIAPYQEAALAFKNPGEPSYLRLGHDLGLHMTPAALSAPG